MSGIGMHPPDPDYDIDMGGGLGTSTPAEIEARTRAFSQAQRNLGRAAGRVLHRMAAAAFTVQERRPTETRGQYRK